jgi:hypothetical protein
MQSSVAALKEVRSKVFSALAHSKVPFNVILDDIGVPRASTHSPLFQAVVDYRQSNKATFADFEGYSALGTMSHSKLPTIRRVLERIGRLHGGVHRHCGSTDLTLFRRGHGDYCERLSQSSRDIRKASGHQSGQPPALWQSRRGEGD